MSAPLSPLAPAEWLREAVRRAVAADGLRATARQVGTSATVLQEFLKGARPYPRTVRKLLDWQVREHAAGEAAPPPEVAQAALLALLRHLSPAGQRRAARGILALLEELGGEAGCPPWLDPVRESLSDPDEGAGGG